MKVLALEMQNMIVQVSVMEMQNLIYVVIVMVGQLILLNAYKMAIA